MDHTPLSDRKHGGDLFYLPQEIRDMIYRYLVKGRYLDSKPSKENERSRGAPGTAEDAGADLSILRVSKIVGYEASEILYSEGVFRFIIDFKCRDDEMVKDKTHRLNRLAPMMNNVVLDCHSYNVSAPNLGLGRKYAIIQHALGGIWPCW